MDKLYINLSEEKGDNPLKIGICAGMKDLKAIELGMKAVYNENAGEYDKQRSKSLFEKSWLDKFLVHLDDRDEILDIGCGPAEPIAKYFIEKGFKITGIDFSKKMIEIAKSRFPNENWLVQDMRELDLEKKFKGIIAWDSFFHLNQEDQKKTLSLILSKLKPGGVFLTTVGPDSGEVTGQVNGEEVYHSSLSQAEYRDILDSGSCELLEFVANDPDCTGHSVLLVKKN
ncbi:MAG: class I SAM-dependent DNA methyltransferase [Bacteriovoracaceae bacterium]